MDDHLHRWFFDKEKGAWVCADCDKWWDDPNTSNSWELKLRPDAVDATVFAERSDMGRPVGVVFREELPDRQRRVYDVLKDGQWHDGPELTHPAAGGSEGLRRLRELREKGYTIDMRRKAKGRTTRQYRLVR
jgi:hypothetical protein